MLSHETSKVFTVISNVMGPLKQCGDIAAIFRYCLIVFLWMACTKYHYITLTYSVSCDTFLVLSKWFGQHGAKSGVLPLIWVFNVSLGFSS